MKPFVIVDRDEGRRIGIKVLLQPEHQALECESLQQVGQQAFGREFKALFLAWKAGGTERSETIKKVEWTTEFVVPVFLLPKDFTDEDLKAEVEKAKEWANNVFPQAKLKFVPRLTARAILRVLSEIIAKPLREVPEILGSIPEMLHIKQRTARVAAEDQDVLLTGEAGSGKQLLAHWIHLRSQRGTGPFVIYRVCPGLDAVLATSELFGHAQGAFSWAANATRGSVAAANSGTLYIPELYSLPPQAQLQLVKFLENPLRQVERLGGDGYERVDVRVIAATRRAAEASSEKEVSEELLNHFRVRLQLLPLRLRREDIPLLAEHFLEQAGGHRLHDQTLAALQLYPWPGNLDELDQALRSAALQADATSEILLEHLPSYIQHAINRIG